MTLPAVLTLTGLFSIARGTLRAWVVPWFKAS